MIAGLNGKVDSVGQDGAVIQIFGIAQDITKRKEAERALRSAVEFFHWRISSHGGYVWRSSSDLTDRRGEAVVGPTTAWVQPPGTPSVGEAMLDAALATGDPRLLDASRRGCRMRSETISTTPTSLSLRPATRGSRSPCSKRCHEAPCRS